MARETKVGMLVGLGFIVCFAIILENRGRRDPVGPQMPHEVLNRAYGTKEEAPPTGRPVVPAGCPLARPVGDELDRIGPVEPKS